MRAARQTHGPDGAGFGDDAVDHDGTARSFDEVERVGLALLVPA